MRAIRISRHQYLRATGLIWLNSFLILILFVAFFIAVWGTKNDRIEVLVGVLILLQAGDTLTRFYVREIVLNEEKGLLQVRLACIMSGN